MKLKECPFCGAEDPSWALLAGHKKCCLVCDICGAQGPVRQITIQNESIEKTIKPASEAWNLRFPEGGDA